MLEHGARTPCRLQGLRQNHIIEAVVRIVGEVCVGVALNDRQALGDAVVDALLGKLDAAPVDLALLSQEPQQLAVAAANIEHARARRDQFGHSEKIDAAGRQRPGDAHEIPRARAAESMKPRVVSINSGTSSRNASWPRSVSISTKETEAPPALRARTMARESTVGNSQSEVKETTQKRVREPLNAFASDPP